jgi:tetratricopeptide (TPR) repeat protein
MRRQFRILAWTVLVSASAATSIFAFQPDPAMLRHLFEAALERLRSQNGADDARTAQAARDLGQFLARQGDAAGAYGALTEAVRIDGVAFGDSDRQTLADVADLATVSAPAASQPLWQRAAKSADPSVAARAFGALGDLRRAAGDSAGAVTFYRQALTKQEAADGPAAAMVSVRLNALAVTVEPKDAVPLLERALAIDRRALGPRHPQTASTEANLAGRLAMTGRFDEAIRAATDALSVFQETLGPDHPRCAIVANIAADCLAAKGDRAAAASMYRLALSIDERAFGPNDPRTQADRKALNELLRAH